MSVEAIAHRLNRPETEVRAGLMAERRRYEQSGDLPD